MVTCAIYKNMCLFKRFWTSGHFRNISEANFKRFHDNSQQDLHCNSDYDIIIVGGGMVGGTMACALGKSLYMEGKKLLLLEANPRISTISLENPPQHHSNRVSAISPGNIKFLETLNIWHKIPRSTPVKKMQVWDSCSDAMIGFDLDNMSSDLCHIIENNMIVAGITRILETELKHKVEVQYGKTITNCSIPRNYSLEDGRSAIPMPSVTLQDGSLLKTKLLIAADGSNSFIAKQANLGKIGWDYDQSAVVATLKLHESTDNIVAWQRFLPTGPIALLPLTNCTSSLVWSTTHQHAHELLNMEEEDFVSQVNNAFWQEYSQNEDVKRVIDVTMTMMPNYVKAMQYPPSVSNVLGKTLKFPLGFSHANEYVKPGLALIGDAIHRIHPLAGQGVNLGFRDVECLTKVLNKAVYEGENIGSLTRLLQFESERQLGNVSVAAMVDIINKLYNTDNPALVALRSIGLITASSTALKEFFVNEAVK